MFTIKNSKTQGKTPIKSRKRRKSGSEETHQHDVRYMIWKTLHCVAQPLRSLISLSNEHTDSEAMILRRLYPNVCRTIHARHQSCHSHVDILLFSTKIALTLFSQSPSELSQVENPIYTNYCTVYRNRHLTGVFILHGASCDGAILALGNVRTFCSSTQLPVAFNHFLSAQILFLISHSSRGAP